ncbi:MAG: hypothetical protein DI585_05125 [Pseudomonas fluorescens]|nr:MAG: hypothetical protein DI585_05125 [Pseudomonas fluorescens]
MKNPIINSVGDAKALFSSHSEIPILVANCEANPQNGEALLLLANYIEGTIITADASALREQARQLSFAAA